MGWTVVLGGLLAVSSVAAVEVKVAPGGDLLAARDQARAVLAQGQAAEVVLAAGRYEVTAPVALGAADSGTAERPVVWRVAGDGPVVVSGGRALPAETFGPVTAPEVLAKLSADAQEQVRQIDLTALGLRDYGTVPEVFRGAAPLLELFFNDQPQTPARWPNEGWAEMTDIVARGAVPRNGDQGTTPGTFRYDGDRPSSWVDEPEVWLHGYWCFDWYDEAMRVGQIDPQAHTITFTKPHLYGLGHTAKTPRRWYAFNLLCELDSPGEWYLDRAKGVLYFWPPEPLRDASIEVSVTAQPLFVLVGASHVTLQGLTLQATRGDALTVQDGAGVTIAGCGIRNTGAAGIVVSGGARHRVVACDIERTGTHGIRLGGGDRQTLTPAGHLAENNEIREFSRRQKTYAPAIHVSGVGNTLRHNHLHHGPHMAIGLSGNNHLIEYNEVDHVVLETDDAGAFYMGRNPSERGNLLRFNYWHDIGSPLGHGNNAIYFDDGAGGSTVFGNVLVRCGNPGRSSMGALFVHGGHQNLFQNNILVDCQRAIGATPWNDTRWANFLKEYRPRMKDEVDIESPAYLNAYPELAGYLTPDGTPRMNVAKQNLVVDCEQFIKGNYLDEQNLVTTGDPGFVDRGKGNYTLRPDAAAFRDLPGLQPIPFDKIGLVNDAWRTVK